MKEKELEKVSLSDYLDCEDVKTIVSTFDAISKISDHVLKDDKDEEGHEVNRKWKQPVSTPRHQPKHIRVFLMMMLCYLKELALSQLKANFGEEFLDSQGIAYRINMEKNFKTVILGDDYRSGMKEVAMASGMIRESDNSRRLILCNRGEDLLSILLLKKVISCTGIYLPLRSYYLQVEIRDSYMNLNLYQVVKLSSDKDKENVESVISIKEEAIFYESKQKDLCQNIWNHVQSVEGYIINSQQCSNNYRHVMQPEHSFTLKDYQLFSNSLIEYLVR